MAEPRPIGFWLRLVDGLINEQFAATLDEHGVTRIQWQLLNVLAAGSATVAELDVAVGPFLVAGETTLEHLSELIDSGWVDATPSAYELTDRGHGARDRLTNVVAGQRTDMVAGIAEDDYLRTVAALEQIAHNLGWVDEG